MDRSSILDRSVEDQQTGLLEISRQTVFANGLLVEQTPSAAAGRERTSASGHQRRKDCLLDHTGAASFSQGGQVRLKALQGSTEQVDRVTLSLGAKL